MAKIIWLVSYPKSGNTWMRVLLANYQRDADAPVDINTLEDCGMASARSLFDEAAGVASSALAPALVERVRPAVYRCLAREAEETLYFKVHEMWGRTDRGESLFPADVTGGVVYILRDPLDVVMSCAHHWGVEVRDRVDRLCDPEFTLGRSMGEVTDQLRQRLGSWSGHVESWLDQTELPVCLVRYEDLRRDTETTFDRVARFCGLPHDAERVRKAIAFSDFKEMQRQERQAGFRERPLQSSAQFFRRGVTGGWRGELAPELVQQIVRAHGPTMRRFGYLTDDTPADGTLSDGTISDDTRR